ncbi:peptide receptor gpcr [Plakobranchus ocellatus]|uniref:Peptide receptor gpcr n=1 Tax=Plakobranchus ocellatus TaxID=259542 RepID=A0AAV4AJW4_9GAST|nr:peptide receptor gpcr [Plakobranchus ocellatus]
MDEASVFSGSATEQTTGVDPLTATRPYLDQTSVNETTPLISDQVAGVFFLVICYTLVSTSSLGVIANIANVLVFWKMGFTVVCNISFFCLSLSDLFCSGFLILQGMSIQPNVARLDLKISVKDITTYMCPIFWCISAFGSWVTALISMERCCCIVLPLKVQRIFTHRTVKGLILGQVIYQVATGTPHYFAMKLEFTTLPTTNETKLILNGSAYNHDLGVLSQVLSYSIPTFLCFILVIIGTIFLVVSMKRSLKFRSSATSKDRTLNTDKELKIIKTIIFISIIYIVCLFPNVIVFFSSLIFPTFRVFNPYLSSLYGIVLGFTLIFQSISMAVNIFVYLKLSSAYRKTFYKLFQRG